MTICTREKEYFFGEIVDGKMVLNEIGKIANQFWQEIPKHFPFVNLDQFVVMPNHVHGILEIMKDNSVETQHCCVSETNNIAQIVNKDVQNNKPEMRDDVRTQLLTQLFDAKTQSIDTKTQQCCVSTAGDNEKTSNTFYKLKPGSLSIIIRSCKSIVTKTINKQFPIGFHWQSRFYDHIIRNDEALNKIREYIIKNPQRWERDRNLPENLWM